MEPTTILVIPSVFSVADPAGWTGMQVIHGGGNPRKHTWRRRKSEAGKGKHQYESTCDRLCWEHQAPARFPGITCNMTLVT